MPAPTHPPLLADSPVASGGSSLLEIATKLVARNRAEWVLGLYPDAAEAGGSLRVAQRRHNVGIKGLAKDPERSQEEAARRARGKVRRYCAANRLNRLGTLTYAGEGLHDPVVLRAHVRRFFRALRTDIGEALPYVWVPEWHKSGHGLHVHFGVGRYVPRKRIEARWPHGFVHIKLLGDLPTGSGTLQEARAAAGYLGKYVGKSFGDGGGGLHRYEVAQRFQPRAVRITADTEEEALNQASRLMRGPPSHVWSSRSVDGWSAPPAVWAAWG